MAVIDLVGRVIDQVPREHTFGEPEQARRGEISILQDPGGDCVESAHEGPDKGRERTLVAILCAGHEIVVHHPAIDGRPRFGARHTVWGQAVRRWVKEWPSGRRRPPCRGTNGGAAQRVLVRPTTGSPRSGVDTA